jgi:hypothetical protein
MPKTYLNYNMNKKNDSYKTFINTHLIPFDLALEYISQYDFVLQKVNENFKNDLLTGTIKLGVDPFKKSLISLLKEFGTNVFLFESEIKWLIYNAQFSNAYTKLENTLIAICDDNQGLMKDIKAKDEMERIKKFLRDNKKLNLDTDEFKILYKKIQRYRIIRNNIIHQNINAKTSQIKDSHLEPRLIKLNNIIYINQSSYIKDFLNDCKSFLMLVINEHNRVYPYNGQGNRSGY